MCGGQFSRVCPKATKTAVGQEARVSSAFSIEKLENTETIRIGVFRDQHSLHISMSICIAVFLHIAGLMV